MMLDWHIQSGFRSSGMFPVNFTAIPDIAYLPSLTSERPMPEHIEVEMNVALLQGDGYASIIKTPVQDHALQQLQSEQLCVTVNTSVGPQEGECKILVHANFEDYQLDELDHADSLLVFLTSFGSNRVGVLA